MAEALSLYDKDGLNYMEWYMDLEKVLLGDVELVLPPKGIDRSRIVARRDLTEDFSVAVCPAALEAIAAGHKTVVFFPKEGEYDRICRDDLLTFRAEERVCRGHVTLTEVFAYRTLFQDRGGPDANDAARAVKRARFGPIQTPEQLGKCFFEAFPEAEQPCWVLAVSFRTEKR